MTEWRLIHIPACRRVSRLSEIFAQVISELMLYELEQQLPGRHQHCQNRAEAGQERVFLSPEAGPEDPSYMKTEPSPRVNLAGLAASAG